MFGFSGEHLLVLLVILLIFGPKRLPDLGHSIGRTLKNFKDAMAGQGHDASPAAPAHQPPQQQISPSSPEAETARAAGPQAEKAPR